MCSYLWSVISYQLRHKQLNTDGWLLNTDHCLLVTVKDTGIGIPKDRLPRIFDRFYQVDSSHTREFEGTGIGLALTKELVELHGGKISVASDEGFGTTFTVRLPLGDDHLSPDQISELSTPSEFEGSAGLESELIPTLIVASEMEKAGEEATTLPPTEEGKTTDREIVLVVEDNADVRAYIRQHLEERYAIAQAANGEEGFAAAQEIIPDLIITDVMMPKIDGYRLCRMLREDEKTSHIPIIMLTAKAGEEDQIEGLETGVDAYLTKPFSPKELRVRVRKLIEMRKKLLESFSQMAVIQPSKISVTPVDQQFLSRLKKIVEENMGDEEFQVNVLCRKIGMGERQLQRKLKGLIDRSPNQYIRTMRLQRAKQLLEQSAGNVTEIAFQVGYGSVSAFSQAFREEFGQAPSAFKAE